MTPANPSRRTARWRRALPALLALGLLPEAATSLVVFDNFDSGGGFHPQNYLSAAAVSINPPFLSSTRRSAGRFTVTGGSFTLDSITVPISVTKNVPDNILRVRLTSDAGGAPGTTLEVLSENQGIWPNLSNPFTTTTTLASASHPLLSDGASYWIVTEPTAIPAGSNLSVDFHWSLNTSGNMVVARQQQQNSAALPSDPWPGSSFSENLAFRVVGTPVPGSDMVTIGNPGNACDTQSQGCFGAVSYSYQIAKYEVTNAQFAAFLNAVAASDANGIYNNVMNIVQSGSAGSYSYAPVAGRASQPVSALSFYDAVRYVNWLHNGQPVGAQSAATTEDGAYTLTGPTTVGARHAGATFAIPTENEWYKAAYYNPATAAYFDWPTGTDVPPTCAMPTATANRANCETAVGAFTDVGSYTGSPSPYGTFDQGGNVFEWNETLIGTDRGVRGGSWHPMPGTKVFMAASQRQSSDPTAEGLDISQVGFRVVPEPGAVLQLVAGIAALLGLARSRRE